MTRTRLRQLAALVLVALAAGAIAARADSESRPAPRFVARSSSAVTIVSPRPARLGATKFPCELSEKSPTPGAPPSQALLDAFAILRRDRRPEDALPAEALTALKRFGLTPVAPESARLLRTTPSGGRAWVVPVPDVGAGFPFPCRPAAKRAPREGLAVVAVGGAADGGGGALADLVRGRAPVSTNACAGENHDLISVSGIVPNGVTAVFLTAPDGTAVRTDVKDNGYEFLVPYARTAQQRYVVWTGGDGTPHVQPVVASAAPPKRVCEMATALAGKQPRVSAGAIGRPCAVLAPRPVPAPAPVPVRPRRNRARPLPIAPPILLGECAPGPVFVAPPVPGLIRPK
jgi:hypothetical protein